MENITIVGFGDSITMDRHVEDVEKRWLSVLEKMLQQSFPERTFQVINSGVGGNSDREKMSRFENDVLNHDPDILLVQFGGNNSGYDNPDRTVPVDETEGYLERIKTEISAKTQIVLITFPHVLWQKHRFYIEAPAKFTAFYESRGGHEADLNQYRNVIKEFANRYNYPIIDLYEAMKALPEDEIEQLQVGDGVHMNSSGDELIAQLVFETLSELL